MKTASFRSRIFYLVIVEKCSTQCHLLPGTTCALVKRYHLLTVVNLRNNPGNYLFTLWRTGQQSPTTLCIRDTFRLPPIVLAECFPCICQWVPVVGLTDLGGPKIVGVISTVSLKGCPETRFEIG